MAGFDPAYDVVVASKTSTENAAADDRADILPPLNAEKRQQKKKSGAFGIFRAALYMLRKSIDEKEAAVKKAASEKERSNGDWKKIVGSIRPLHVQETPMSPMHAMSPAIDAFAAASPAPSSSSSCGTMSQYASATNLRDLCNSEDELEEEERDPDEVFDAITGDEEIDAKAEEFIAQFYREIQHQNSIHRKNRSV